MTRTATKPSDAVLAAAAALAFAAALTAMLELSRAPMSADFILPRGSCEFFIKAKQDGFRRAVLVWSCTGLVLAAAAAPLWRLKRKPWALAVLAGAAWAMIWSLARFLTLREPAAPTAFLAAFFLAGSACMAALRADARWGAAFLLMISSPYIMPARVRERASPRVEELSAAEVRRSLFAAHEAGDGVARLNLLENLSRAPDVASNRELLESLSDEARWRVGPRGAAMLSRAYARFGLSAKADYWRGRADIPSGLLAAAPPLTTGRIHGVLSGMGQTRAALFSHDDPDAPYGLEASRLVADAVTDAAGRFEFDRLALGDYYLAVLLKDQGPARFKIVTKGDIRLTARTPVARFEGEALK